MHHGLCCDEDHGVPQVPPGLRWSDDDSGEGPGKSFFLWGARGMPHRVMVGLLTASVVLWISLLA
jgi:hypothetical protein